MPREIPDTPRDWTILAPRQVEDLKHIQFRGEYPQQPEQYEILYSQLEFFTHHRPKGKP